MPIEIRMPALSPTMTEGNLARWLKKEGDEVHAGDVIAEIETDKATMEYEAADEGRIGKIIVPEGKPNQLPRLRHNRQQPGPSGLLPLRSMAAASSPAPWPDAWRSRPGST